MINRPENSSNILLPKSPQANIGDNESASATNPIKVTARKLKGNITNELSAAQNESTINQKEPLSVENNTQRSRQEPIKDQNKPTSNRQEPLAIQKPTRSRNALLAAQNKPDLENDYSSSDEDFDIPKQPSTRKNKCTTQNKVIVKNARHNESIKDLIPRTLSPQEKK